MNGSAPKWSSTGSQTLVQRKLQPKAARACADCVHSSTPMVAVMTKTESAKVNAAPRKVTSANRDGRRPDGEGRGARCAPRGDAGRDGATSHAIADRRPLQQPPGIRRAGRGH